MTGGQGWQEGMCWAAVPSFTPAHNATFLPWGCPRAFPPRHKRCVCPFLTECTCTENGVCNGGLHGDGFCFCAEGWTGERCETRLGEGCSALPWDLLPHGCFPRCWVVQAAVQKYLQNGALGCEALLLNFTRVGVGRRGRRRKALLFMNKSLGSEVLQEELEAEVKV